MFPACRICSRSMVAVSRPGWVCTPFRRASTIVVPSTCRFPWASTNKRPQPLLRHFPSCTTGIGIMTDYLKAREGRQRRDNASGNGRRRVTAAPDERRRRGGGIRTTDGGWLGGGRRGSGFAELTMAGREATEPWIRVHTTDGGWPGQDERRCQRLGLGIRTTDGGWPGRWRRGRAYVYRILRGCIELPLPSWTSQQESTVITSLQRVEWE
jgi:hypothetical protein